MQNKILGIVYLCPFDDAVARLVNATSTRLCNRCTTPSGALQLSGHTHGVNRVLDVPC